MMGNEMFIFLDKLRESGTINMFGAPRVLEESFGLSKKEARNVFQAWTKAFEANNIFMKQKEMNEDQLLEVLKEKCKVHDWFYQMTNGKAYYAGKQKADEIDYIRGILGGMDCLEPATLIIESFKPEALKTKGYLV
tara:strand:- start:1574 stop:1981 length:408 start_codon:yes stop_codon:yes gene_type:complete